MSEKEYPNYEDEPEINFNFELMEQQVDGLTKEYMDLCGKLSEGYERYEYFIRKANQAKVLDTRLYYTDLRNKVVDEMTPLVSKYQKAKAELIDAIILELSMVRERGLYYTRHYHHIEICDDDDLFREFTMLNDITDSRNRLLEELKLHAEYEISGVEIQIVIEEELGD